MSDPFSEAMRSIKSKAPMPSTGTPKRKPRPKTPSPGGPPAGLKIPPQGVTPPKLGMAPAHAPLRKTQVGPNANVPTPTPGTPGTKTPSPGGPPQGLKVPTNPYAKHKRYL